MRADDKLKTVRKQIRGTILSILILCLSMVAGFAMLATIWEGSYWVKIVVGVLVVGIIVAVVVFTLLWAKAMLRKVRSDEEEKRS